MYSYTKAQDIGDVAVQPGEVRLLTFDGGDLSCDSTSWLDLRAVP